MRYREILLTIGGVILFALVTGMMSFGWGRREATIVRPLTASERVTWEGTVIAVLESGSSLAIERSDGMGAFVANLAEPTTDVPDTLVLVTGSQGEETCAYRNTVFAGECVKQLYDAVIDELVQ